MPVKYEQENNIKYVVIENEICLPDSEYEQKMIEKNNIACLLSMQVRKINNRVLYFYDITSRQTMSKLFAYSCVRWDDFLMVIREIENAARSVDEYMLGMASLVIKPEYIYIDTVKKRLQFIYFPGNNKEFSGLRIEDEIKKLFDYLLERFDHEDKEHIMAVYEIYQKVIQNGYKICSMTDLIDDFETNNITAGKTDDKHGFDVNDNNEADCKNILSDVIPPEIIEDETEDKNTQAVRTVKYVKILSAVMFAALIINLFIPSIMPFRLSSTISFISAVVCAAVYFILDRLPGELFIKTKKRSTHQSYSAEEPEQSGWAQEEAVEVYGKKENFEESQNTAENIIDKDMEHTMLLSEYLNSIQKKERRLRLIYVGDGDTFDDIIVDKLPCLVGSLEERCNHVIANRLVSHIHMCILKIEQDYYVEDMNSTNGTYINGEKLEANTRKCVFDGDEVVIAALTYKVEIT